MFHTVVNFAMELSLLYLLIATFIILDMLLLSIRVRRQHEEKETRQRRDLQREAEAAEQRKAFEQRQAYLKPAQ